MANHAAIGRHLLGGPNSLGGFLEEPGDSVAALELALAEAEMSLLHGEGARAESLITRMLARTIPIELRRAAVKMLCLKMPL